MGNDDANNLLSDDYQIADQNFLFEIMEIRLQIESSEVSALQTMLDANKKTMQGLISKISAEFEHDSKVKGSYSVPKENIAEIRELLAKLTYFHRIEGEIKERLPSRE